MSFETNRLWEVPVGIYLVPAIPSDSKFSNSKKSIEFDREGVFQANIFDQIGSSNYILKRF
jgi:hypothetical protein